MKYIIEILQNVPSGTMIKILLCMISLISGISYLSIRIYNIAQKWRKIKNQQDEQESILYKNKDDIVSLTAKVDGLIYNLDNFIEKDKTDKQSIIRDRIQSIYRMALEKRYIIEEDKKNFSYLYNSYIKNDGNSYICDTVKPFLDETPIFSTIEDAELYYKKHGTYK